MSNLYFPLFSGKVRVNIFAPACFWLMLVSEGAAAFCCILAGVAVHETGHAFFIFVYGQKITRFEIEPFGGLMTYTSEGLSYEGETAICAGGILFNLIAAFLASLFLTWCKNEYLFLFILSCIFFAVINLVPLKSNDGGRLIYLSALKRRGEEYAEKAQKRASIFGAALLLCLGAYILYLSGFNNGLCIFFLLAAIPK
ncbi:MAG: M50 family metallopeptidase [Victivallales bacterium]|nr:M50 family metallopeptidase [Eubacteriales bacterium]